MKYNYVRKMAENHLPFIKYVLLLDMSKNITNKSNMNAYISKFISWRNRQRVNKKNTKTTKCKLLSF